MLRSTKSLRAYTIRAQDGDIGEVDEFLFDDQTWSIRYLVVKTGSWLSERKVLLSPIALGLPDWENKILPVLLTQEQVKNSPPIDTHKPVSRQRETELFAYYNWSPYWRISTSPLKSGGMAVAQAVLAKQAKDAERDTSEANPHLRSTREVIGYRVYTLKQDVGYVDDLIVDDQMWETRYFVVDLEDKKVLLSPAWIATVDWAQQKVAVDLDETAMRNGPAFDPTLPVNREYEVRLYDYYGRPKYWVRA